MKSKRLAVFVEGQTEQLFLREFIEQIAGQGNIDFECQSIRNILQLKQTKAIQNEKHKILIYDCQGDEVVKSVILEQRASLVQAGYSMILGLRDLYPETIQDLQKVKAKLQYGVPTAGVPTHILLAVAEIEAWFLQEHSHFPKIDPTLDVSSFKALFDFDPATECAETVAAPPSCCMRSIRRREKRIRRRESMCSELCRLWTTKTYIWFVRNVCRTWVSSSRTLRIFWPQTWPSKILMGISRLAQLASRSSERARRGLPKHDECPPDTQSPRSGHSDQQFFVSLSKRNQSSG